MKILALSNVEGGVDELVDALSETGAAVVGKEVAGDTRAFCLAAVDALHKNYDMVVGFADDYITAEMALNKNKGIRAVRCGSRSEVEMASRHDPNVVIISGGGAAVLKEVVAMVSDMGEGVEKPAVEQKKPHKEQPARVQRAVASAPAKPMLGGLFNKKPKEEEPEEDEEEEPQGPKRPGVVGKLKDALGIIDEESDKK